jgi:hypothetical protein
MHDCRPYVSDQPRQLAQQSKIAQRVHAGAIDRKGVIGDAMHLADVELARFQRGQVDLKTGPLRCDGNRQTV